MIGTIIVYIIIVLPFAHRVYMVDKGEFNGVKILNLIITFLISWDLSHSLREQFYFINNDLIDSVFVRVGVVPPIINGIGYFIYILTALIGLVLIIGLAIRNKKTYNQLKYLIPFLWLSDVIYMNFKYFNELQSNFSESIDAKFFWLLMLILGIYWAIVLIIYNTKRFRNFFKQSIVK